MTKLADAWAATSGTVQERIEQLRARKTRRPRPIPAREVKRLWAQRMVLAAAKFAADSPALDLPLRVLCLQTYDNLMGDLFNDLDPSDPTQTATIDQFLDGLQAAGVLSDAVRAETLALGFEDVAEFSAAELDYPALYAAKLISAADAGFKEG